MNADQKQQNAYLGDGVYASFDGYQIWLGLSPNQQLIALEPEVMAALVRYADRVFKSDTKKDPQ
jgi:hypothetical protein